MHHADAPALVAALAMLVGIVAQVVARHAAVPGVVLLLIAGVALGPDGADLIRPQALGAGLEALVGFAVAVILFEGGLNLDIAVLRRQAKPIRRLVLLGAILTALGGAVAARLVMGWGWRLSFLFGTLVIVTGPTVITPILRRIHARHRVETILEAEGIFIDAVGATIAVVALEVLLAPAHERTGTAALGVAARFGVGTVVGAVGGALLALLMRFRRTLPEGMANVTALASAVALFAISNTLAPESGITAAILAGMAVGNTRPRDLRALRTFKEELSVLLVATLFVLLAADVRLAEVRSLGWAGGLTVLCVSLVVRPVNVFLSTVGTELEVREKLFLSWLAPRGIVAAAISSLFAERMEDAGIPGGGELRALVFLVIATTVIVQGSTAGIVASWLGLRLPRDVGYAVLGAHPVARVLGRALATTGEEVVLIDTNPDAARVAEEEGFKVVFGDGLDDRTLRKARVETRRACIGATTNESVNLLFARRLHEHATGLQAYVAFDRDASGVTDAMIDQARSRSLAFGARSLGGWCSALAKNRAALIPWEAQDDVARDKAPFDGFPHAAALRLTVTRGGVVRPAEARYVPRPGDVLRLLVATDGEDPIDAWMAAHGWSRREAEPTSGRSTRPSVTATG